MSAPVTARPRIEFAPDPALSFWPTPPDVADDLVMLALCPGYGDGAPSLDGEVPQVRVLEPSAGEGHIARAVRKHLPYAHITAVEPSSPRAAALKSAAGLVDELVETTVENYLAAVAVEALTGQWQPFELVLMNPPFTLDGRPEAWAEHVLALWNDPNVLAPGGTLGAVVPSIALTGQSKLVRAVRGMLGTPRARYADRTLLFEDGQIEPCERGAFDPVGAGVNCALLWAYKPLGPDDGQEDR